MGYKVVQFQNLITQPLNTHNFLCRIPGFGSWQQLVSSTTFPMEQLQVVTRYIQGERVQYPAIPQNGGTWNFTLPEGDNAVVFRDYLLKMYELWSQPNGMLNTPTWESVDVIQLDLKNTPVLGVSLQGSWLQGVNPVSLSNSSVTTPWDWQFTLVYQYIIPNDNLGGLKAALRNVAAGALKGVANALNNAWKQGLK